ncbi:MAG: hypothetical protein H6621_08010 [Halobacteriovoraceae bacterium]|nr:hypothetical protein [Halobacteriovoraceae bacterium]
MRNFYLLLFLIFLTTCSSGKIKLKNIDKESWYFLEDVSGTYDVKQSVYTSEDKIYFEKILYDPKDKGEFLEKYHFIAKFGGRKKTGHYLVPIISQYKTWIDRNELYTEIKIRPKLKKYQITTSNNKKENLIPFVESNFICPFSFIADCLRLNGFLEQAVSGEEFRTDIWIMWDNYPFNQKIYARIFPGIFFKSKVLFEGVKDDLYLFTFEVSGQSVTLLYNKKLEFEKMFWVAQGLSFVLK